MMAPEEIQARIREVTSPLPGSLAKDQLRPIHVPLRFDRYPLLDFLVGYHPHHGLAGWTEQCNLGRIICKGKPLAADRIVRAGEQLAQLLPGWIEPDVNASIRVIHSDAQLLVLHKPAPLPMHPSGRFNRNSLSSILRLALPDYPPILTHRLDANTSGLVVFGWQRTIAAALQRQFEAREVGKWYLARVHGTPAGCWVSEVPVGSDPCEAGARLPDRMGRSARTEFRFLHAFTDGTSLVEARPITGRTNQIRLHLWDAGYPIVGDPVYQEQGRLGETQTLSLSDPPMCLHAFRLELTHPVSHDRIRMEDTEPLWSFVPSPDLGSN